MYPLTLQGRRQGGGGQEWQLPPWNSRSVDLPEVYCETFICTCLTCIDIEVYRQGYLKRLLIITAEKKWSDLLYWYLELHYYASGKQEHLLSTSYLVSVAPWIAKLVPQQVTSCHTQRIWKTVDHFFLVKMFSWYFCHPCKPTLSTALLCINTVNKTRVHDW